MADISVIAFHQLHREKELTLLPLVALYYRIFNTEEIGAST